MNPKRINDLVHEYSDHSSETDAYLLIHGVRGGIDEAYIQTLLGKLIARGDSALAFNFPYMSRGETVPSGGAFDEELGALQIAYDFLKTEDKTPIHIIAKSFGGIAVSLWLAKNPDIEDVDVNIMGYIPGEGGVNADALRGKLNFVVQGEYDKYAGPEVIKAELLARQIGGEVIEIRNADHSYRDMVSSDPPPYAFQEKAIDELLQHI